MKTVIHESRDAQEIQSVLQRWNGSLMLLDVIRSSPSWSRWTLGRPGERRCIDLTCHLLERVETNRTNHVEALLVAATDRGVEVSDPSCRFRVVCALVDVEAWETELWIPRAERDEQESNDTTVVR